MTWRTLVGRKARVPLMWAITVLIATPITGALVKGTFWEQSNWPLWVAFIGSIVGALGLLAPWELRDSHRPHLREYSMITGAVVTSFIVLLLGSPAYEPSMFTVVTFLCTMVILFGHETLGATVGFSLITIRGVAAAMLIPDAGILDIVDVYTVIILSLALTWIRYARKLVLRETAFRQNASSALRDLREQERALAELQMKEYIAASDVKLALERLVATGTMTPDLLRQVRTAEAGLRDYLRSPAFEHTLLKEEIRAARNRGSEVLLLGGNRDPERNTISDELASSLANMMHDAIVGDRITVRELPGKSGGASVFVERAGNSTDSDGVIYFDSVGRKLPPLRGA